MRARLEGAMAQRRLRGWRPPLENVNSLIASAGPRLLARARELVVTNGYAANASLIGMRRQASAAEATPDGRANGRLRGAVLASRPTEGQRRLDAARERGHGADLYGGRMNLIYALRKQ